MNPSRFGLCVALSVACPLHLVGGDDAVGEPTSKPNVVLIMTDDQGYGDLSLHGNPVLKTPVLDRFGREGIRFDRFYVSPVCAPTRASLLTGRYSLRTGVWGVTHNKEAMRLDEATLADVLREAGYRTACIGKWHNGEQYPYTAPGRGFDEFFGFHNGHWNNYFGTTLLRGNTPDKTRGYIADVLTDEALDFVKSNRKRPFFLYLAYNTPHGPWQVPDRYFDEYKALGLDDRLACVYAMCANLDDNVGRLLDRLEKYELRDNTIVVFLTDNGPNTDRFNAGMRGRKGSVHEGGMRVPCFLQWPARFAAPREIGRIAAHIDLMPTLLELCDVAPPPELTLDGRSLVPLLDGKTGDWPDRMIFGHQFSGGVYRSPGSVRTQRFRAVNTGEGWRLFDMVEDPGEDRNLAADLPEVTARLSAAYEAWFDAVTDAGFERLPIPVGYDQENPVTLNAPQARLEGVRFRGGIGWANDWVTGWTDPDARVTWRLNVVRAGTYEIRLLAHCPKDALRVKVTAGKLAAEEVLKSTKLKEVETPDRVPGAGVGERVWKAQRAGVLQLERGETSITVEALKWYGPYAMELKGMVLKRL